MRTPSLWSLAVVLCALASFGCGLALARGYIALPANIPGISRIFASTDREETQSLPSDLRLVNSLRVFAVGDMMFGRGVALRMASGTNPFQNFDKLQKEAFPATDYIVGNLEGPITNATRCQVKPYSFRFATSVAPLLYEHGFRAVNVANNHSYDCYERGLIDTRFWLSEAGVEVFGGGAQLNDSMRETFVRDMYIGWVGIDETIAPVPLKKFSETIARVASSSDVTIIQIHWGNEYQFEPTKTQQDLGHALVDSGATVVIGHHPHVVEPVEIYHNRAIFYSLGNFIFDQIGVDENRGIAVGMEIFPQTITYTLVPFDIDWSVPTPVTTQNERLHRCEVYLARVPVKSGCSFTLPR